MSCVGDAPQICSIHCPLSIACVLFEKGKLFMMDWVIVGDCSRWDLGELGLLAGRNGAVWGRGGRRDCGRRLP